MSSKTSFFNCSLAKKSIKRTMPVWLIHAIIWIFSMPIALNGMLTNSNEISASGIAYYLYNLLSYGGLLSAFVFCAVMSEILSNYMYSSSSASFYHSLPIKRSTIFSTHLIVSFGVLLLPMVLVSALTVGVMSVHGIGDASVYAFRFLGHYALMCVFFTGFSLLCCHITGHTAIGSLIYIILNFTSMAVYMVISFFCDTFIYGYTEGSGLMYDIAAALSPVFKILTQSGRYEDGDKVIYSMTAYISVIAAVGLILIIAAWLFYRKRRIESTGEIISIPSLRPVFKYCVTAGCALILGALFYTVAYNFTGNRREPSITAFTVCTVLGGMIGYFGSEMMLRKKINVFKKSWKGFAVSVLVLILCTCSVGFDLFKVEGRIPETADIESIVFDSSYTSWYSPEVRSAESIDKIRELHKIILENKEENLDYYYRTYGTGPDNVPVDYYNAGNINLTYMLKNGRTLSRDYFIPFSVIYQDEKIQVIEHYREPILAILEDEELIKESYPALFSDLSQQLYTSYITCNFTEMQKTDDVFYASTSEQHELRPELYSRIVELTKEGLLNHTIHAGLHNVVTTGMGDSELPCLSISLSYKPEYEEKYAEIDDGKPHAAHSQDFYIYGLYVAPEAQELTAILTNPDSFVEAE